MGVELWDGAEIGVADCFSIDEDICALGVGIGIAVDEECVSEGGARDGSFVHDGEVGDVMGLPDLCASPSLSLAGTDSEGPAVEIGTEVADAGVGAGVVDAAAPRRAGAFGANFLPDFSAL